MYAQAVASGGCRRRRGDDEDEDEEGDGEDERAGDDEEAELRHGEGAETRWMDVQKSDCSLVRK